MKVCKRCGVEKPLSEFSSGGKRSYCRPCDSVIRIQNGQKKRPARKDLLDHLRTYPCAVCGLVDPYVADFHHLEEPIKTKEGRRLSFSHLVNGTTSEKVFIGELVKCVVVCANDHRRFHAGRVKISDRQWTYEYLENKLRSYEHAYEPEKRQGEKFCPSCKQWRDVIHFYQDKRSGGYQSWCRECKKK